MASYKACNNPQCPKHHIKHLVCNKPDCDICSTKNGPILCDEMITDTGAVYKLTQRERDIAKIVQFFHDTCRDQMLHSSKLEVYGKDPEQFSWLLDIAVLHYMRKCSEGWTCQIHCLSERFPATLAQHFKATAIEYNVLQTYTDFLKENIIDSFIDSDSEEDN